MGGRAWEAGPGGRDRDALSLKQVPTSEGRTRRQGNGDGEELMTAAQRRNRIEVSRPSYSVFSMNMHPAASMHVHDLAANVKLTVNSGGWN